MNNAIELSHVTKTYPTFALRDLSLTLPTGCIMGLVGENGAGKSTTLRLIMNTITRDSGEITVLGQDNRSDAFRELKNDIGVVLDEAYFPAVLNPRQVGQVMAQTYTRWDEATYASYVDRFALPWKQRFKDFSRGMKMKLAIAVALSHSPRLLLLDEATSGLDPMIRDEILETFSEFTRDENHSVLLSSHIVSDLEKICDYIAFLHRGRLVLCEEKDALLDSCAIVKCTRAQLSDLPEEAVLGMEQSPYGVRALVRRELVSPVFSPERPTLEDIILFLAKGEEQR